MKLVDKFFAVSLCLCVCVAGAILSFKPTTPNHSPKRNALPIDNRQPPRAIWIWA